MFMFKHRCTGVYAPYVYVRDPLPQCYVSPALFVVFSVYSVRFSKPLAFGRRIFVSGRAIRNKRGPSRFACDLKEQISISAKPAQWDFLKCAERSTLWHRHLLGLRKQSVTLFVICSSATTGSRRRNRVQATTRVCSQHTSRTISWTKYRRSSRSIGTLRLTTMLHTTRCDSTIMLPCISGHGSVLS